MLVVLTDELISLVLSAANLRLAVAIVPPVLSLLAAVIALARLLLPIFRALGDLLLAPVVIATLGTLREWSVLTRMIAPGVTAALSLVLALMVAGVRHRGRDQEDQCSQAAVGNQDEAKGVNAHEPLPWMSECCSVCRNILPRAANFAKIF